MQEKCLLDDSFKKEVDKINQTIKENKKTLDEAIASQTKGFKDLNEKLGKSYLFFLRKKDLYNLWIGFF